MPVSLGALEPCAAAYSQVYHFSFTVECCREAVLAGCLCLSKMPFVWHKLLQACDLSSLSGCSASRKMVAILGNMPWHDLAHLSHLAVESNEFAIVDALTVGVRVRSERLRLRGAG